jgi:hypothetical protein
LHEGFIDKKLLYYFEPFVNNEFECLLNDVQALVLLDADFHTKDIIQYTDLNLTSSEVEIHHSSTYQSFLND